LAGAWGSLVEKREGVVHIPQKSFLFSLLSSNEDSRRTQVIDDLMKELSRMRKEVSLEYKWFKGDTGKTLDNETVFQTKKRQRKRMLFLFLKDLANGVSGDVMSSKVQRDSMAVAMKFNRVPSRWKRLSWLFVLSMIFGMLFYVYLFAMRQTHSRQSAWFQSFLMWILFEIFVSSTGMVVFFHLLIPLYVLTDVVKLKMKVLTTLKSFRDQNSVLPLEGNDDGRFVDLESNRTKGEFNAAKYLFTSWRVASLLRSEEELPESKLVLRYKTLWPSKRFGSREGEVSGEYEQAVVLGALSRILLYFLGSLLRFHMLVQDILIQMLWTSGLGYFGVCLIGLSRVNPLLPLIPLLLFSLVIYFILRLAGDRCELAIEIASDYSPAPPPPDCPLPRSVTLDQPTSTIQDNGQSNGVVEEQSTSQEPPLEVKVVLDEDSSSSEEGQQEELSINYSCSSEDVSSDDSSSGNSREEHEGGRSKWSLSSEEKSE
jgi:hypothetical protein